MYVCMHIRATHVCTYDSHTLTQIAMLRAQALEESGSQSQTNARLEDMLRKMMTEGKDKEAMLEQVRAMNNDLYCIVCVYIYIYICMNYANSKMQCLSPCVLSWQVISLVRVYLCVYIHGYVPCIHTRDAWKQTAWAAREQKPTETHTERIQNLHEIVCIDVGLAQVNGNLESERAKFNEVSEKLRREQEEVNRLRNELKALQAQVI